MSDIKITNVYKKFGKSEILKGINLEVKEGQVVALLGSSGSGKTTFLRSINFLEPADNGELMIGDQTVQLNKASKKEKLEIRKRTAMVFQQYDLFQNKTALQNVLEGLTIVRKVPKDEALKNARKALEEVGLLDKESSYPSQLSGGQQQRVGIARALAICPDVLLIDEPTSALDPETIGEVLNVIKKLAKNGATMIITTHEMQFAYEIADKIVFIDKGVVVEEGEPKQVFNYPKHTHTKEFLARYHNSSLDSSQL